MKMSDGIGQLALALAKAQAKMSHAAKDSTNPHFKSKYADLASVWDAIRGPLSENDLSITQLVNGGELITMLMHKSGEYISSSIPIIASQNTAQAYGSGLTYARRYSLAAIAGIAQDDDDGNAASAPASHKPPAQLDKQKMIADLLKVASDVGISKEQITHIVGHDRHLEMDGKMYKALEAEIDKVKKFINN